RSSTMWDSPLSVRASLEDPPRYERSAVAFSLGRRRRDTRVRLGYTKRNLSQPWKDLQVLDADVATSFELRDDCERMNLTLHAVDQAEYLVIHQCLVFIEEPAPCGRQRFKVDRPGVI